MDETLIKRIQPHSIEAEQSVVGSMFMDKEAIITASELLTREDFYNPSFAVLFEAVVELFNEGKAVDLITVQNRLKEKDVPPEVYDLKNISDIVSAVPTSAHIRQYSEIVAEKALMRKLIKMSEGIANTCYLDKERVDVILEQTEKQVFDLVQNRGSGGMENIRQIVICSLEGIEAAAKNKGSVTGVATGFYDLDYKTAGLQPSDLILVAARPSMGKTAFVLNIAEYVALKTRVTTAIFSLEMSKTQLVNRMLAMNSRVDSQAIRTGELKDDDWAKQMESARLIGEAPLIWDLLLLTIYS